MVLLLAMALTHALLLHLNAFDLDRNVTCSRLTLYIYLYIYISS